MTTDFKFSDESVSVSGETKIDTETTTDEKAQDASTDENNDAIVNAENLDKKHRNKMDSPKDLNKENKENADYMFVGDKIEKSE